MNHLGPMQRTTDGRWDYTYNGRAFGYCCEYSPIPEDGKIMPAEVAKRHNEKMQPFIGKFHADGHATSEEACECYKQYLLDTQLILQKQENNQSRQGFKCRVCDVWTTCIATAGPYKLFMLCPEHQTRENVEKLLTIGETWES